MTLLAGPALAGATTVAGHVTDHLTGQPLANIQISIWYQLTPFSTEEVGAPVTAADGSYTWTGACPEVGSHPCHVSVNDVRYIYGDTTFSPSASTVTADLALIEPATISGELRIDGAAPSAPLGITIRPVDNGDISLTLRASIEEADGHFVIHRVPPDTELRICAGGLAHGTVEQCYDGHDRTSLGVDPTFDPISTPEGQLRSGVDFDLASGGHLSGTLHDGYLGVPLTGAEMEVRFYDASGDALDSVATQSNAMGAYTVSGIPAGAYYVSLRVSNDAFYDQEQVYPAIGCDPDCPPATNGQLLSIASGAPVTGVDATFHPTAVLKGRVTDSTTGLGIGNIGIWLTYDYVPSAKSAPGTGDYVLYASAQDTSFHVFTSASQPYIDQVFPGIACIQRPCTTGQVFAPTRGSVFEHVDFALQPGAAISGTVLDALTGAPRYGTVSMYDSAFNLVWSADLDGSGTYASGAWYPGTYYVKAEGYPGYVGYDGCAFYADRPCPQDGQDPSTVSPTPITIGAGEIRGSVDFLLLGDLLFGDGFD